MLLQYLDVFYANLANLSSKGEIVPIVLLASDTIKPEAALDEELSSDTEDSNVERAVRLQYLAPGNQAAELHEPRAR